MSIPRPNVTSSFRLFVFSQVDGRRGTLIKFPFSSCVCTLFDTYFHDMDGAGNNNTQYVVIYILCTYLLYCFLTTTIARRNMSIEDVTTEIRRGKNGQRDFVVNAEVVTAEKMDQEHLWVKFGFGMCCHIYTCILSANIVCIDAVLVYLTWVLRDFRFQRRHWRIDRSDSFVAEVRYLLAVPLNYWSEGTLFFWILTNIRSVFLMSHWSSITHTCTCTPKKFQFQSLKEELNLSVVDIRVHMWEVHKTQRVIREYSKGRRFVFLYMIERSNLARFAWDITLRSSL